MPDTLVPFHLNGTIHYQPKDERITYERVCELAGRNPDRKPTVTVAYKDTYRDTTLTCGEAALVAPGTVINCFITGRA